MSNSAHRPRKRFGQNFLTDTHIIAQIVAAINPCPEDALVEIGPGQGALTEPLLKGCKHLDVIEIDRDLASCLRDGHLAKHYSLAVHEADVLHFDFAAIADDNVQPLRVVGNLPYNISSPLLFRLLPLGRKIRDMHFMLQLEVVQRMAAVPGSKTYGRLSVMVQACCHVEPLFEVPPSAFSPPPKVNSAIVRLIPLEEGLLDPATTLKLSAVTRAAFAQRRKTLRNSLSGLFDTRTLTELNIDSRLRAEALEIKDYINLARALKDN